MVVSFTILEQNSMKSHLLFLFTLLFFIHFNCWGQPKQGLKYPTRTRSLRLYKKELTLNPNQLMVDPQSSIPDIQYDLRYATLENFTEKRMYPVSTQTSFLRLPAVEALKKVADSLRPLGIGIKIFDAYRPFQVTARFWRLIKDERYVANPAKGSGHNRGIAIDLTLLELSTRKELNMGTGFDNFSDTAHHSFYDLPAEVIHNRMLLRNSMINAGFIALETEWWHYSLPNPLGYSILDVPFRKLKKNSLKK